MRYCGRDFSEEETTWIRQLIADRPEVSRKDISVLFCQKVGWLKADGGLKDMSCRVALLKMEKDGHFTLPAPKTKHTKPYKKTVPSGQPSSRRLTRRQVSSTWNWRWWRTSTVPYGRS